MTLGVVGCALFLLVACKALSPAFPRDYRNIRSELQVWENLKEGFALTLVSNPDRAQGFLEWGRLGIYGRIAEAKRSGGAMSISLGDGGMNGLTLEARLANDSIRVSCSIPPTEVPGDGATPKTETVIAKRTAAAAGLEVLAAQFGETQKNGRDISIRLQYVCAKRGREVRTLDEALRRGRSSHEMAEFRREQQEAAPVVVYQQDAGRNSGQAAPPPPQPPLQYEEIQYPVYISQKYMSIATQHYLFNGGAHGAASTDFDVIDRAAGTRLGPDDILKEGWKAGLIPAIEAELLRQGGWRGSASDAPPDGPSSKGLKALGLFDAELSAPDKVFLCMTGVGFEYDRYQIAPWAMGEYIAVLPWDQVTAYLKDAIRPF